MDFIKKLRVLDYVIIGLLIIAGLVGIFTAKNFRQTASKQIEATSKIAFTVCVRGLTYTGDDLPIKAGEKAFITIRNVPYTELEILDVKAEKRKQMMPALNGKSFVAVEDVSLPGVYDALVILNDTAKITKDGAVVGGNKIKIGLPITLEGQNYRFSGTVSDLKVIHLTDDEELNKAINSTGTDVQ